MDKYRFRPGKNALTRLNAEGVGLQTEHALEGLWNVTYFFPIFGFAIAAFLFFFVKVDRKKARVIMKVNSGEMSCEDGEKEMKKTGKGEMRRVSVSITRKKKSMRRDFSSIFRRRRKMNMRAIIMVL